jgi:hypothetical protein
LPSAIFYRDTARADAALDDGNLLPEDMNEPAPDRQGFSTDLIIAA